MPAMPLRCPLCGGAINITTVQLMVCAVAKLSRYCFDCTHCVRWFCFPAAATTIDRLQCAGAVMREVIAEVIEASAFGPLPPLNRGDLDEFMRQLNQGSALAANAERFQPYKRNR